MKKIKILIFIFFALLVSSCINMEKEPTVPVVPEEITSSPNEEDAQTQNNDCLEPFVTFDYDAGIVDFSVYDEEVPLPEDWKLVTSIPDIYDETQWFHFLFLRNEGGVEKFWFISECDENSLLTYSLEENRWEEEVASMSLGNIPDWGVIDFFIDHDNKIWISRGTKIFDSDLISKKKTDDSLLAWYDEENKTFVEFPLDLQIEDPNYNDLSIWKVQEDYNNRLWILVNRSILEGPDEYYLYSVDKTTGEVIKSEFEYQPILDFGITEEKILYIVVKDNEAKKIILYGLETNEETVLWIPLDLMRILPEVSVSPSNPAYLDRNNKLWFNAHGWLDLETNQWTGLLPSPLFIDTFIADGMWRYLSPNIIFEAGDGRYWFYSFRGSGWLSLEEQKWCVITSAGYYDAMAEDKLGNVYVFDPGTQSIYVDDLTD